MKRSEALWSRDTARNTTVAILVDADGREWAASINNDPSVIRPRFVTNLVCRSEGRLISTALPPSLEAAQEWCYSQLGLEE
jgi:hypothetical protein